MPNKGIKANKRKGLLREEDSQVPPAIQKLIHLHWLTDGTCLFGAGSQSHSQGT